MFREQEEHERAVEQLRREHELRERHALQLAAEQRKTRVAADKAAAKIQLDKEKQEAVVAARTALRKREDEEAAKKRKCENQAAAKHAAHMAEVKVKKGNEAAAALASAAAEQAERERLRAPEKKGGEKAPVYQKQQSKRKEFNMQKVKMGLLNAKSAAAALCARNYPERQCGKIPGETKCAQKAEVV